MFARSTVTLNIESDEIRYLVVRGKRILTWGSIPLPPGLIRHGSIVDSSGLSSAINTLYAEKELPRNGVIASMTGLRCALRILSLPKVKASLLDEAIRYEAEREMPVALEELYLSRQLLNAKGAEQRFFVLGVPRDLLDTGVRTLELAGVRPEVINLKPLALARAVNRKNAVIIDLENDSFDLVVVAGRIPTIMRTVTSASAGIILEDRIPQLRDELARTIDYYNASNPGNSLDPETPIILTGLLADDPAALDLIRGATNSPIETLTPPGSFPPDFPLGKYAVNIGLARRRFRSKSGKGAVSGPPPSVNPNVLVRRHQRQQISPTSVLYPMAAVGLAALLFFVYQWKADIGAEITDINSELVTVNLQIDDMRDMAIKTTAATRDAEQQADRLIEERDSYLGALATSNLSESFNPALEVIPEGVQITSINQTADQIILDGDAQLHAQVAAYVLALERTGVFNNVYVEPMQGVSDGNSVTFTIIGDIAGDQQ